MSEAVVTIEASTIKRTRHCRRMSGTTGVQSRTLLRAMRWVLMMAWTVGVVWHWSGLSKESVGWKPPVVQVAWMCLLVLLLAHLPRPSSGAAARPILPRPPQQGRF